MADQANIWTKLGFDGRGFEAGLLRTEKGVMGFSKRVGRYLAGAFTIAVLTRAAQKTIEWGSTVSDLAISLGVTNEEIQELEYAAKKTGAGVETIGAAFRRMSKFRADALADPKSRAGRLAEALGLTPDELRALDKPIDLFQKIGEIFRTKNFGGSTQAMIQDIFSEQGFKLMPMFIEGIQKLRDEAKALGIVVKDDVVTALDEMRDRQRQIIQQLREPWAEALAVIYGWLLKLVEEAQNLRDVMAEVPGVTKEQHPIKKANEAAFNMYETSTRDIPGGLGFVKPFVGTAMFIGEWVNALKDNLKKVQGEVGERAGETIAERSIAEMARQIAEEALKARIKRTEAEQAALDSLAKRETIKTQQFKPASDALARIGGFVGRGAPAVNYAKLQLDVQKKIQRDTKRTADALGPGI